MERDITALITELSQCGFMVTRLDPEEIDEIEAAGFVVEVNWKDDVGGDGKRQCSVSNKMN